MSTPSTFCHYSDKIRLSNLLHCLLIVLCLQSTTCSHLDITEYTPDELRDTFGVLQHSRVPLTHSSAVPQFECLPSSATVDDVRQLLITLPNDGRHVNVTMHAVDDTIFSGDALVVVRDRMDGHRMEAADSHHTRDTNCHYRSQTAEDGIVAAVSVCDGHMRGVIIDSMDGSTHVIHPLPERHQRRHRRSADQFGDHVIYKRSANVDEEDLLLKDESHDFCGIEEAPLSSEEMLFTDSLLGGSYDSLAVIANQLVQESDLVVEIAMFLDYQLWDKFSRLYGGGAEAKLKDYVATTMNNIQVIYSQPSMLPRLTFRVTRYEIMKSTPSAIAGNRHSYGNAQRYLDVFCRYQAGLSYRDWDHAFLLSGYDLHQGANSKSISGIARLKGMCNVRNSCTVTEGLDFTSVFIGAHEMGHSVGMGHDEPYCSSRYIMSASLGPGKTTWSTCSMRDYHKFLQRMDKSHKNCLRDSRLSSKMSITSTSLPGQQYTADQQCALMHGSGYTAAKPRGENSEGVCHMMWCGQRKFGRIITSHPALEGTICRSGHWCRTGKCVAFSTGSIVTPKPQLTTQTNGGWTAFSSVTCSNCRCPPFGGAHIGVLAATRACNNPAPANGGSKCAGKDTMGVVCNSKCSASSSATTQSYIDNVCANHRETKRDYELTGTGTQLTRYAERACKVFCKVRNEFGGNANYRFNGDVMPDGTACHEEGMAPQYCVSGNCLPLTCSRSAVADSDMGCPSSKCANSVKTSVAKPPKRRGRWSSWSAWSSCSVTCGSGRKRRARYCTVNDGCDGETEETGTCQDRACTTTTTVSQPTTESNVKWSAWSQFGSCTRTCGPGVKRRTRRCLNGNSCVGDVEGSEPCELSTCPTSATTSSPTVWAAWSAWSLCSTTCGSGTRTRSRWCSGGDCPSSRQGDESESCNRQSCSAEWTSWGDWTACSVTCDGGVRARYRRCKNDDGSNSNTCPGEKDERGDCRGPTSCKTGISSAWSSWTAWSSCDSSCSAWGTRKRSRSCPETGACVGVTDQNMRCYNDCTKLQRSSTPSGRWSTWSMWNTCSRTCGSSGIKSRQRTCSTSSCDGDQLESIECNRRSCNRQRSISTYGEWGLWSTCSRTCGGGQRQRFAQCTSTAPDSCQDKQQLESCGMNICVVERSSSSKSSTSGLWSSWSVWSDCSQRCGGGQERRRRVCSNGSCAGKELESRECNTHECAEWGGWGHWSACSMTCASTPGTRRRIRNCYGFGDCAGSDDTIEACTGTYTSC